jgi:hypothetical protein
MLNTANLSRSPRWSYIYTGSNPTSKKIKKKKDKAWWIKKRTSTKSSKRLQKWLPATLPGLFFSNTYLHRPSVLLTLQNAQRTLLEDC